MTIQTHTHLIYAGGTFGSHGTPLSPLSADIFLPLLESLLGERLTTKISILPNTIIKDSSALTPCDFVNLYQTIYQAHTKGIKNFVLITGTDSLSFLSAFLANALAGLDLSLVITGSMSPLLHPDMPYQINDNSDAWHNLACAITVSQTYKGVFVQFDGQTFWANNTQKIHSQHAHAFDGISIDTPIPPLAQLASTPDFEKLIHKSQTLNIASIYLLPNEPTQIAQALNHTKHATAVILIAFGAGNLPNDDAVRLALADLSKNNTPVVCTSMCAFGGVNTNYQAGAWQYDYGVWSGKTLSIAGIYGKLLWLALTDNLTDNAWENS